MKRIGRILAALFLIGAAVLGLVACKQTESDVPEGFLTATCYGADYRFYVPSTWTVNNTYGVSAAYRTSTDLSTVSVHKYTITEETETALAGKEDRLASYWETELLPAFRDQASDNTLQTVDEDCIYTMLGNQNALQRHVTAQVRGETAHCIQLVVEYRGAFYVFTYLSNEKYYDLTRPEADRMIKEFKFSDEPYVPEGYIGKTEEDPDAPAGMKAAHSKDVPYRFYVPAGWEIDPDRAICSAWDPTDRTNVSVLPYSPDQSMSLKDYFDQEIESLEENGGIRNVARLSEEESELGGRKAMKYEFSCEIDGTEFHYLQYLVVYKSRIYCLTYTATSAAFEAHLGELETMVNNFSFR